VSAHDLASGPSRMMSSPAEEQQQQQFKPLKPRTGFCALPWSPLFANLPAARRRRRRWSVAVRLPECKLNAYYFLRLFFPCLALARSLTHLLSLVPKPKPTRLSFSST
ncbi:Hypothetical predicted protein, partial [Olea europaea subsp. europaea]